MDARGRILIGTLVLLAMCAVCAHAEPPGFATDFTYTQRDGAVDILKGSTVIASYVYKDTPRPYIYPLLSPSGLQVTRNYPMKTVAGEPTDHAHHRSMWIGFGNVNGMDFWADTRQEREDRSDQHRLQAHNSRPLLGDPHHRRLGQTRRQ